MRITIMLIHLPIHKSFSTTKGIYCGSGDFQMPRKFTTQSQVTSFFAKNYYTVPFIAFQGIKDKVVPYDNRFEKYGNWNINKDPNNRRGNYDSTSYCLDSLGVAMVNENNTDSLILSSAR